MWKQLISVLLFVVIGALAFIYKDTLMVLVEKGGTLAAVFGMLIVALDVFFPVIPFVVIGGVIGGLYGVWVGTLITLTGSMLGTMILFYMARYGFREWAQRKVEEWPKVKHYEEMFEKNSFLAILISRAIPIIPNPVINVVCGLSQVSAGVFFVASTIGKIPNNFMVNYAGAHFEESKWFSIGVYSVYALLVGIAAYMVIRKTMPKEEEDRSN